MKKRCETDRVFLKGLEGKHVIAIIGFTGVGKSMLARAMHQGAEYVDIDNADNLIATGEPII